MWDLASQPFTMSIPGFSDVQGLLIIVFLFCLVNMSSTATIGQTYMFVPTSPWARINAHGFGVFQLTMLELASHASQVLIERYGSYDPRRWLRVVLSERLFTNRRVFSCLGLLRFRRLWAWSYGWWRKKWRAANQFVGIWHGQYVGQRRVLKGLLSWRKYVYPRLYVLLE